MATAKIPGKILDIGTGTGVVALLMAQKYPERRIDAIEIEPLVAKQALFNIQNSPFKDRVQVIEADFLQYHSQPYACIVSNPPYFKDHLEKAPSEKNTAIHASLLDHTKMMQKISEILDMDACFYCILPPFQMKTLIAIASENQLYPAEHTEIFNQPGKHYRDIVCFSFKNQPIDRTKFLLHDDKGNKTDAFHRLMYDFYLEDSSIYKKSK